MSAFQFSSTSDAILAAIRLSSFVLAAAGALLVFVMWGEGEVRKEMHANGIEAEARIVSAIEHKGATRRSRRIHTYRVTVSWQTPDGSRRTEEKYVSRDVFQLVAPAGRPRMISTPVRYLEGRKDYDLLIAGPRPSLVPGYAFGGVIVVLGLALAWFLWPPETRTADAAEAVS